MTRPRLTWVHVALLIFSSVVFATLIGLGTWQVQRLAWKQDLIAQVNARAFAAPIVAPTGAAPAYLNVTTTGRYAHDDSLLIKAVTDFGPGFWVMTPLETEAQTLWVNRGFVPTGLPQSDWINPAEEQVITGLARLPVADGTWLETNDPVLNRWFSADLPAMSAHVGRTTNTAYYIDAAHTGDPTAYPRGGLTKIAFRNSHLSYAITWYVMAALMLGGIVFAVWDHRRPADTTDQL